MTISKDRLHAKQGEIEGEEYFTDPEISKMFILDIDDMFDLTKYDIILEPSAGSGNILEHLPKENRIGLDIDPKIDEVIKTDFFDWEPPGWEPLFGETPRIITIGNPPFGRNSDLALKFFHHASQWSDTICFIIPVTWDKYHIQKKIPNDFGLYYSKRLDPLGFIYPNGERIKNPIRCVAQIWSREHKGDNLRLHRQRQNWHEDFEIVKDKRPFDLWMAYWGGGRKQLFLTPEEMEESKLSISGFRKIKFHTEEARETFLSIDWEAESLQDNVGCWNLSEETLVEIYKNNFK